MLALVSKNERADPYYHLYRWQMSRLPGQMN